METFTITIPKNLTAKDELVVIPRKEYEAFLTFKNFKEAPLTKTQKRALHRADKNLSRRKTLSLNELAKHVGFAN